MASQSDAQLKASKAYHQKLDDIKIRRPKGDREKIKAYAESKGMSLNGYINMLIDKDMNGEKED